MTSRFFKHLSKKVSSVIILSSCITVYSQKIASPYQVGTWQGFRSAAISYTFDDGCPNQFAKAIPIFDSFGYKLTLFTVTGPSWTSDWARLQAAADNGHEVANHTVNHLDLSKMTVEDQAAEVLPANETIDSNVKGQKCITIAYPYCNKGKDSLYAYHFVAARGCSGVIENPTPYSFMNVSSIICGDLGSVKKGADFSARAQAAASKKGWLVYLIHGIDNDGGYSPLSSDTLRVSLAYLNANNDKYWVSTFANVARYARERNCLSLVETSSTDNSISLELTDTLDNDPYNVPVTIRRPMPDGWSLASASQDGKEINSSVVLVSSVKYLVFDAVPDGGEIILTKTASTGLYELTNPGRDGLTLWQDHDKLFFNIPGMEETLLSVSIMDIRGSLVKTCGNSDISDGCGSINLAGLNQAPGMYIVLFRNQDISLRKQIVLF